MSHSPLFVFTPSAKEISGMAIRRVLPQAKKRMVGPFIFLDHMGPHEFEGGHRMEVRAHPHIGLSTLTYLFEGQIHHRDSLGNDILINPGEVNWMTAGSGISHSERGVVGDMIHKQRVHGLQFWVALPDQFEDMNPHFEHYQKSQIPRINSPEIDIEVVVGKFQNCQSQVKTYGQTLFLNLKAKSVGQIRLNEAHQELGVYLISGHLKINGENYESSQIVLFSVDAEIEIQFAANAHFIVIGGQPFATPRNIFWNFVSSSKEKIELAKLNWNRGDFPMVPGESERLLCPL